MQVSSIGSGSFQPAEATGSAAKLRQSFQQLGNALESGNLSDAKSALAELERNAPPQAGNESNPISTKVETLSKALDSGDLKAAQAAYNDIKKTISQGHPAGGRRAGHPSGPPPGGAPPGGAKQSSNTSSSSSSNKVYDKKDTNKDGTVSMQEELAYSLKHADEAKQTSVAAKIDGNAGSIDITV